MFLFEHIKSGKWWLKARRSHDGRFMVHSLTWSRIKSHHKNSQDLVLLLPLTPRRDPGERQVRTGRLRASEAAPGRLVSAHNHSCDVPCGAVGNGGGDGGDGAAPPRTGHRCPFVRRGGVVLPLRLRRRLGRLVRVGRWDLLPVQQRGSVRLLHHDAAAPRTRCGERNGEGSGGVGAGSGLNTLLGPDHGSLLMSVVFHGFVSVSHPRTGCFYCCDDVADFRPRVFITIS